MDYTSFYVDMDKAAYGQFWYLKMLQWGASSGGGSAFLGTLLPWKMPFLRTHYPLPYFDSPPGLILDALTARGAAVGLPSTAAGAQPAPAWSEQVFASSQLGLSRQSNAGFGIGAGPFPSVPVQINGSVEYSSLLSVQVTFGAGTKLRYIRLDLLNKLWLAVTGDSKQVDPTGVLDGNCFTDAILLSKDYSVSVESSSKLDLSFDGSVSIPAIPGGKANVTFARQSDLKITATVHSDQDFLIALSARFWSDCDPT